MKVSGVVVGSPGVTALGEAKVVVCVADLEGEAATAGDGAAAVFPTTQVCSGVKLGGEQGVLLRKPSGLRVKHWFPGPTPLLTAFRTKGKLMLPKGLAVELKKNCWSAVV